MTTPKIVLGTMTFGLENSNGTILPVRVRGVDNIRPFLDLFSSRGYNEIDTARVYCSGDTEIALGQLHPEKYKVATKVWPITPKAHGAELLKKALKDSLEALKIQKVDIFYLHAPDYSTPFEETIKAVDDLYREGRFERFGLSNFAAWQVALIHGLCKQHGYVLPSVYQGMYNAITRDVVRELLPCLKALDIAFYAFNPIAGGFLSGKYKFDEKVDEGRFDEKNGFGKLYRERYWSTLYFDAIQRVEKVAKEHNITLIESALRWITHHSGLGPDDAIIIGASSPKQLEDNLNNLEKGPLPKEVVDVYDEVWEQVKVAAPSYFKSNTDTNTARAIISKK